MIGLVFAALFALACFIVWELGERHPLVDVRLFARRNFAVGTIGLSLGFLLMYGLLSLLLVRLQSVAGYTAFLAGSVAVPLALLAKPIAGFLHRIVHRYDARLLASLNLLAFAAFCFWTSRYDFFGRYSLFTQALGSQVLEGLCLGGLFVPLTTLFLSGLSPRRQIQAVELGGMLRVLGGAAGSPLLGVLWERRAAFHHSRLAETLTIYDPEAHTAFAALRSAGIGTPAATAELARRASGHAAILGLDDTFRWAAWMFLALAAFVWLARPAGPTGLPNPKENNRRAALEDLVEEP
jgi:DHA2 family multidrug resistance protein